jgi:nucleoid-associated protein YgaU
MNIAPWVARAGIAAAPASALVCVKVAVTTAHELTGPLAVEAAAVLVVSTAGAVVAGYLTLVTITAAIAQVLRRGQFGRIIAGATPRAWRPVLALAFGAGLVAGAAIPATAFEGAGGGGIGWVPDATPVASAVALAPSPHVTPPGSPAVDVPQALDRDESSPTPSDGTYVVKRGDSLWRITEALIGPGASVEQIAQAWPHLYQANRGVVGSDPSLIFAGQSLQVPASLA